LHHLSNEAFASAASLHLVETSPVLRQKQRAVVGEAAAMVLAGTRPVGGADVDGTG
jgi:SAM-dependent MidA family methyltransferase